MDTIDAPARLRHPQLWLARLAWLGALWIGGVAAMGLVTVLLRWSMRLAGLA